MVTVNTLLIACLIVGALSAIWTISFFMLLSTYLSVKGMKPEEKEEEGQYLVPLSSLGGVPQRIITQDDINRARDAILRGYKDGEKEKDGYVPNKGSYL